MPLRTPNTSLPPAVVLRQFALVLPGYPTPNTQLALSSASGNGSDVIFIRDKFALLQQGRFPAVNLRMGQQTRSLISRIHYAATVDVWIDYYDAWDQQSATLDQLSISIGDDLERIAANLETNETLTTGGQAYAVSLPTMHMSDDRPFMEGVVGAELPFRSLRVVANLLPYDATS